MSGRVFRWVCRFRCGTQGTAVTRREARKAERVHVDVGKLISPEKHTRK